MPSNLRWVASLLRSKHKNKGKIYSKAPIKEKINITYSQNGGNEIAQYQDLLKYFLFVPLIYYLSSIPFFSSTSFNKLCCMHQFWCNAVQCPLCENLNLTIEINFGLLFINKFKHNRLLYTKMPHYKKTKCRDFISLKESSTCNDITCFIILYMLQGKIEIGSGNERKMKRGWPNKKTHEKTICEQISLE